VRIVFIDTETSDLPDRNPNAEIIAYTIQPWVDGVRGTAQTVHLFPRGPVAPEAQRVNGYTEALWHYRGAVRAFDDTDLAFLRQALDNAIVGGHNTGFDTNMIELEFARRRTAKPDWNYRKVDTQAMAMGLVGIGVIQKAGLVDMAKHFGIPHTNAHTSFGDVETTILVWEKFLEINLKAYGF